MVYMLNRNTYNRMSDEERARFESLKRAFFDKEVMIEVSALRMHACIPCITIYYYYWD